MAWTKVSDSRWERPVDGLEGYFTVIENFSASLCEGREHYVLFSKIKLVTAISDLEPALRHAWKQLRHDQPQLATTLDGMKKVYEVPDEKALEEWLASTFIVSPASDAEELFQTGEPIKQATLYYIPKSSELIFRAHHHTIDGTGVLLFWHSYLSVLASPAEQIIFGDEVDRLAPAMEETLGFSPEPTEEQLEKSSALLMQYLASMPGIGPVSKLGVAPSGKCRNVEHTFSTKTTEALVKACKEKKISVTAAIHAAYIEAIAKHADPASKVSKYVSASQFNLRQYLPSPYNSSQYAVSVYYTPLPYLAKLPVSYWDSAKTLNLYYQSAFKGNAEALELKGHFTRLLCNAVQHPEFAKGPVSKDALVSSLGIAETYLQREYGSGIKVEDIKIGVDVVLGMSMFFFYTFQDQLRLVYCFNDGFEEPENIQLYLDDVQNVLVKELL